MGVTAFTAMSSNVLHFLRERYRLHGTYEISALDQIDREAQREIRCTTCGEHEPLRNEPLVIGQIIAILLQRGGCACDRAAAARAYWWPWSELWGAP